ncbi:hypothetical protein [Bradyrhizobium monzae]|uniref:hypothetical protein n=1 Tax=Bradyrhizobium sp. Oc8 TaxID=2876780 RepID=UPI001F1C8091|nr:hypothetical protein [Bradyrhizobium sp. Oc8]
MVVPKATGAAFVKVAAARDEKEAGVMKAVLDGGDILEPSGVLSVKNCSWD